ncbi:uncharacterized protein LOC133689416 [Populus nigra]|uniref:uncharacterized protein LOC133689416 n=1 Tax=Populus nigra TaxID=3691 RepID=UPI002B264A26|nr:uncharacterized protein LOC133689416 [Populus nigra]
MTKIEKLETKSDGGRSKKGREARKEASVAENSTDKVEDDLNHGSGFHTHRRERGKYKNEVLYDVVPMHATHLLLRRLWQFARKAKHDGFKNNIVKVLLHEFKDIFPEEIPSGLPPIRGIEHQIDLVPGASIPNRSAYRSNPEESKELQRQVEELMSKRYICQSMSPFAVHMLLVLKKDKT